MSDKPSESEFRAAGYTANAISFPISDAAVEWLCKFNGAPDGWKYPRAWNYAPNAACQAMLERNAAATGAKSSEIGPLTHDSLTDPSRGGSEGISEELGNLPQQT